MAKMKEFSWDLTHIVSPLALEKVEAAWPEGIKERSTFCQTEIDSMNQSIHEWIAEGTSKCYENYIIPTFEFLQDDEQPVMYYGKSASANCTPKTIALAKAYVSEVIKPWHEQMVNLYASYDAHIKEFKPLILRVGDLGGQLTLNRPYVDVDLPLPGSLDMRHYQTACNRNTYAALVCMLESLESAIMPTQKVG